MGANIKKLTKNRSIKCTSVMMLPVVSCCVGVVIVGAASSVTVRVTGADTAPLLSLEKVVTSKLNGKLNPEGELRVSGFCPAFAVPSQVSVTSLKVKPCTSTPAGSPVIRTCSVSDPSVSCGVKVSGTWTVVAPSSTDTSPISSTATGSATASMVTE